jgi:hypothetical protein
MKGFGIAAGAFITLGAYYLGDIDSGNDLFVLKLRRNRTDNHLPRPPSRPTA